MKVHLVVEIDVLPGKAGVLLDALDEIAKEPCEGTEVYVSSVDTKNPDKIWISELYRDEASLKRHQELASYKALQASIGPLLAGAPRISVGHVR